jgi:hypothetical protein
MVKKSLAFALFLGIAFPLSAAADDDTLARFKGGTGVHPVSNVSGTATNPPANTIFPEVTRNIVRGVVPAGQVWVIDKLEAQVRANGQISVKGKGLILAGGDSAGRATGQSVFATLICAASEDPVTGAGVAPFTQHSSSAAPGVLLTRTGDFEINDMLSPAPPFSCPSPVLLIRSVAGQWFAVGHLKVGNDD